MSARLDFDGLDAIVNDLNKMNDLLDSNIIDDALEEAIQPAYKDAVRRAPSWSVITDIVPSNMDGKSLIIVIITMQNSLNGELQTVIIQKNLS